MNNDSQPDFPLSVIGETPGVSLPSLMACIGVNERERGPLILIPALPLVSLVFIPFRRGSVRAACLKSRAPPHPHAHTHTVPLCLKSVIMLKEALRLLGPRTCVAPWLPSASLCSPAGFPGRHSQAERRNPIPPGKSCLRAPAFLRPCKARQGGDHGKAWALDCRLPRLVGGWKTSSPGGANCGDGGPNPAALSNVFCVAAVRHCKCDAWPISSSSRVKAGACRAISGHWADVTSMGTAQKPGCGIDQFWGLFVCRLDTDIAILGVGAKRWLQLW